MKTIIIDDDATARLLIKKMCNAYSEIEIVSEFSNAVDAIKFLNKNDIEVIFLDIHMPLLSGFDFIKTLKKATKIILTSSDENYALEAFEYSKVVDYLVKPISKKRFEKSIHKLKSVIIKDSLVRDDSIFKEKQRNELYVSIERRLVRVPFSEINFVEAKGDYVKLKTDDESYIIHSTLKKIEAKLPSDNFLKIHRSFVINLSKIIDIKDNSVLLQKEIIPISKSRQIELITRLNIL
ncbi:MAG: LytTR family DNA-binding domain-containing protein [Polaribacter sp.]|nr:LytTR family DNA-binding domain-containing protein [Polaribacter sp.]MDG1993595.1 LytTR family DNA-binding domain-containing protein [Polaribacter sp.]